MGDNGIPQEKYSALTVDLLKGKQSVRATFRLPTKVIDLLSIAANQLGIKQKSLFDQLVEDRNVLDHLAGSAKNYTFSNKERQQKTYVLSRNSLSCIDEVAEQYGLSRDILVEMSINRLRPVISAEQKKQKIRKSLIKEVSDFIEQGREIRDRAETLLGPEDPFVEILDALIDVCLKKYQGLGGLVEKGKSAVAVHDHAGEDEKG